MFYIQKNDKPNIIEKTFNIIKMQENKLFLPITAKTSEKQIEKLAQKTKKIISKYSNSKRMVHRRSRTSHPQIGRASCRERV